MAKKNKRTTILHLLWFCYVCIKALKKTNVLIGALQDFPLLLKFCLVSDDFIVNLILNIVLVSIVSIGSMHAVFSQICDALSDLVPYVQFKKREKNPWRKFTFSKVAD